MECKHRYDVRFIDCCLECGEKISFDDMTDEEKAIVEAEALELLKGLSKICDKIAMGQDVFSPGLLSR